MVGKLRGCIYRREGVWKYTKGLWKYTKLAKQNPNNKTKSVEGEGEEVQFKSGKFQANNPIRGLRICGGSSVCGSGLSVAGSGYYWTGSVCREGYVQ